MNINQKLEIAPLTKREIIREIGDHATFVKKAKLKRMVLTKREEYLMIGLRVYIIALITVIILNLVGII